MAVKLCTYSDEQLNVNGVITVEVQYNGQSESLPLIETNGQGSSLLGRDWLTKIRLDWTQLCNNHVCYSLSLQGILADYSSVFDTELGNFKGFKATIRVDPTAQPHFCKPRAVPYALKEKIGKELDRLLKHGVIEKINFSEWGAPIVPVMKKDGSVRICGDYKMTVNQASKAESYPLPKIDDLLARWLVGRNFQNWTWQMHTSRYPLMRTQKSWLLSIHTKAYFSITGFPWCIYCTFHISTYDGDTITRLVWCLLYLDDILITGKTDQEHLSNLAAVLQRL